VVDVIELLGGPSPRLTADIPNATPSILVVDARQDTARLAAYRTLRHHEFVARQRLFPRHDTDEWDEHPETIVLTAIDPDGGVLGGVRLHPELSEIGWWRGSRLVTTDVSGPPRGIIGRALVRAACARALDAGALRFDAHVQVAHEVFFTRLGWETVRPIEIAGEEHRLMRWPVTRLAEHAKAAKASLGPLVGSILPCDRWRGDDCVPLEGSDLVACVDAIAPAMVERDPGWAGWCGMLVTANDLAAMGAAPLGALDAAAGRDAAHVASVLRGVRAGSEAFDLPVLGGHTQLGVPGALSVSGFGRVAEPVAGGGGSPGDALWLCADVEGGWRPGYHARQWDSTSWRTRDELRPMLDVVRRARPHAAKDASMAGIVGTISMLCEASGCGAELELDRVPRPAGAEMADWLSCFPGFALVLAQPVGAPGPRGGGAVSACCGRLTIQSGVRLRWPDGELTTAIDASTITGLGAVGRAG
jgi:putative N-acetyltransferase (TIGR04045 family)